MPCPKCGVYSETVFLYSTHDIPVGWICSNKQCGVTFQLIDSRLRIVRKDGTYD